MLEGKKVAFVGGGFMARSIIKGVLEGHALPASAITVAEPVETLRQELSADFAVHVTEDNEAAVAHADVVILAVKPQVIRKVAGELPRDGERLHISVAAGITTGALEEWLPEGARVIRVMPNVPVEVGRGAVALCEGTHADPADMTLAYELFETVGAVLPVEEKLMNAVTALSGSGPAFVFLFIEALIDAGVRCGLPRATARKLAVETVAGSAQMLAGSDLHPAQLIDRVTSPGGTTIAGLAVLEDAAFKGAIIRAVEEAADRAAELG